MALFFVASPGVTHLYCRGRLCSPRRHSWRYTPRRGDRAEPGVYPALSPDRRSSAEVRGHRSSSPAGSWKKGGTSQPKIQKTCPFLRLAGPHLNSSSWDRAWSTCRAILGGSEMDSRISFNRFSRKRMRGPKTTLELSGLVGKRWVMFFRAELRFCLWMSRVKKQEGHDSHVGKESQRPRPQELQRGPVTPGRHKHAPVCLLQPPGRVPSGSHRHPGKEKSGQERWNIAKSSQV